MLSAMEIRKSHAEQAQRAQRARLFAAMTKDPQVRKAYLTLAEQWEHLVAEHERQAARARV